jgi:hypothetical protein
MAIDWHGTGTVLRQLTPWSSTAWLSEWFMKTRRRWLARTCVAAADFFALGCLGSQNQHTR